MVQVFSDLELCTSLAEKNGPVSSRRMMESVARLKFSYKLESHS